MFNHSEIQISVYEIKNNKIEILIKIRRDWFEKSFNF